jgi:hypothetical protein
MAEAELSKGRRTLSDHACREDRHRLGPAQAIGGGITRRLCTECGSVSIDLTAADDPAPGVLFRPRTHLPEPITDPV